MPRQFLAEVHESATSRRHFATFAVTLGSTLSSMILANVPVLEGLLAVAIIIGLQFFLAKAAQKSEMLEKVINSRPALLFFEGRFIEHELLRESVTRDEIYSAVRSDRIEDMEDVRAVIMEMNGQLTVVKKQPTSSTRP